MTKLLDDALTTVRDLPPDEPDNIARAVLRLTRTDDEPPVALSVDETRRYCRLEIRHHAWRGCIDLPLLYPAIGTRTDDPTIVRVTALPPPV
jgi:hypothetical protein